MPCRHLVPGLHDQSAHRASGFSNGLLDLRCTSPPRLASVSGDEPSGLRLWECQSRRAPASQGRRSSAWVFALCGGDRARAPAPPIARGRRRPDRVSAPEGRRPCCTTCTAHECLHAVTCTNSNSVGICLVSQRSGLRSPWAETPAIRPSGDHVGAAVRNLQAQSNGPIFLPGLEAWELGLPPRQRVEDVLVTC